MLIVQQCTHLQNGQTALHGGRYRQHLCSHIHLEEGGRVRHQERQTQDPLFTRTHASPPHKWPSFFLLPSKIYLEMTLPNWAAFAHPVPRPHQSQTSQSGRCSHTDKRAVHSPPDYVLILFTSHRVTHCELNSYFPKHNMHNLLYTHNVILFI